NMGRAFRLFNPDNQTADAIHVKNSENIDLGNNWTMETWVKVASIMGERTAASLIINKWDAFNIGAGWQHFGGAVNFANGSNVEFYHPQEYQLNEWYHVAMISNAAENKVYFYVHDKNYNQIFKDVKNFPAGSNGQIVQNENLLTIGGLGGGSNLELDGYLDELRITKEAVDYSTMVVGTNDIQKQPDDLHFSIYPNPITNESIISFQTQSSEKVNLAVYDIQGRKICTLLDEKLNAGIHTIPVGNQIKTNGVYLLQLATSEGVSTVKLIVNDK
ncbi:MAG: T9SS type A sorting domain-containing protein, partial [Bacteroidia bacterium]|nr:T9SS type A sorting domain-containing protein [Bacteroidia bacterium]